MTSGVYGVVVHSVANQAERLAEFIDFLAGRHPGGARSVTVREVIERGLLAHVELTEALLREVVRPRFAGSHRCSNHSQSGTGVSQRDSSGTRKSRRPPSNTS